MIIPQERPRVALRLIQKPLIFRLVTIQDEAWIRENLPNGLQTLIDEMKENRSDLLLETVWHFLEIDTKKAILAMNVELANGADIVQLDAKDYRGKLKSIIGGSDEISACLRAILQSWRLSMPEDFAEKKARSRTHPKRSGGL
jgi:hypothetical protein